MPELPEVETLARGLQSCVGLSLHDLTIYDKKVWFESEVQPSAFAGRKLLNLSRRGKYLVFDFGELFLLQHLRMTGKMLPLESPVIPEHLRKILGKNLQIRCQFGFAGHSVYFYDTRRFGTLTAIKNLENFWKKKEIAPDPIASPEAAFAHFAGKVLCSGRPIKAALLDQSWIAGVGNIYADEALHAVALHPQTPANQIQRPKKLFQAVLKLFAQAIEAKGTSVYNYVGASGEKGGFATKLKVYGREGEKCAFCEKAKIKCLTVGGRTSHFCPLCQAPY